MSEPTNEERFIDLETRLSYADDALRVLSDTVVRQQDRIDTLDALCRQLLERVKAQSSDVHKGSAADEIPPHY